MLMTSGGSVDEHLHPPTPTPIRKQGHMKEKQYEGDVCLSTKTSFPTELTKITTFFSPQQSLFFDQILLFVWQMQKEKKTVPSYFSMRQAFALELPLPALTACQVRLGHMVLA